MNTTAVEPTDSAARLEKGIEHHRAGRLGDAEYCYKSILQKEPNHPDALHLMGVIAHQSGNRAVAMELINKAIAAKPMAPEFYNSLGAVQQAMGNKAEAVRLYLEAIRLKGDYVDAYNNLVRLQPDVPDVRFNLALVLHRQGKLDEALQHYARVIELQPAHAGAHNNLGCAFVDLGRLDEAIAHLKRATELEPRDVDAHNNLGHALQEKGLYDESIASLRTALSLRPDLSDAHFKLGRSLQLQGHPEEAIRQYRRVLELTPNSPKAYYNWAFALHELGRIDDAIDKYEEATRCDPKLVEGHVNRALLLLMTGRYPEGLREYEWRLRRPDWLAANCFYQELPRWDGSVMTGNSILVQAEQGFGDTIQFSRYLPMVKARCGRLIVEAQPELHALLAAIPDIDELTAPVPENARKADVAVHIVSLPGIFGTTFDSIPSPCPYLHAPAERMERWKDRIPTEGIRIGITWSGNPAYPGNKDRSCGLHPFARLAAIPSVHLFSLQKGVAAEQLKNAPAGMEIIDLGPDLRDFADTAAAVMHLDLVVSVDTALVHLAGALGKPIWTLRYHEPYWVWGVRGERSPWYPTMRIFRQKKRGQWDELFQEVVDELRKIRNPSMLVSSLEHGEDLSMDDEPAFNKLKQCRHGKMLFNVNDRYIGKSLDLYGEYSEEEIFVSAHKGWVKHWQPEEGLSDPASRDPRRG